MGGLEEEIGTETKKMVGSEDGDFHDSVPSQESYISSRDKGGEICWSLAGPFMFIGAIALYHGIKSKSPEAIISGGLCEAMALGVIWVGGYSPLKVAKGIIEGIGAVTHEVVYKIPRRLYGRNKARKLINYRKMREDIAERKVDN